MRTMTKQQKAQVEAIINSTAKLANDDPRARAEVRAICEGGFNDAPTDDEAQVFLDTMTAIFVEGAANAPGIPS